MAAQRLPLTSLHFACAEGTPHFELTLPTSLFQVSEQDVARLEGSLGELEAAEAELRLQDASAPLIEQDMLSTRLAHMQQQQMQVQQHIIAARAQLREVNRKWYEFW